jgi:hypothetical protein
MSAQLHVLAALPRVSYVLEAWWAPKMPLEAVGKRKSLSPAEKLTQIIQPETVPFELSRLPVQIKEENRKQRMKILLQGRIVRLYPL